MSIVAPSVNPFHNVAQRRSCGAYTTTTVIPTPRPVSARGTPRMGRPTPEPLIVLGSRPEGRDAPAITSRRSSVSMPRYRENWNDTSEARDGIASEGRGRSSDARPHRIVIGSTSLRRPLRPENAKSVVRARVPVIGVEAPSAQGAAAAATKMRREQLSASTSRATALHCRQRSPGAWCHPTHARASEPRAEDHAAGGPRRRRLRRCCRILQPAGRQRSRAPPRAPSARGTRGGCQAGAVVGAGASRPYGREDGRAPAPAG
jgi:hypothetical protein